MGCAWFVFLCNVFFFVFFLVGGVDFVKHVRPK